MPLPILPASNTPRFRVFYTTMTFQHSLQIRSHVSPAVLGALVASFMGAFGTAAGQAVIDYVDWAPEGSDIFNPVTTGIEGNTYSASTFPAPELAAAAIVYSGRTAGGRRVRISRFAANGLGTNYRFSAGENGNIDAVYAALVAAGDNIRGIDDLTPVWKTYANVKPNDHWVKHMR